MKYCPICSETYDDRKTACRKCEVPLEDTSAPPPAKSREAQPSDVKSLLRRFLQMTPGNVFKAPNIPPKKLQNARGSHGIEVQVPILLLVDHTFFGSAKNSTVVTPEFISYVNDDDRDGFYWAPVKGVDLIESQFIFWLDDERTRYDESWPVQTFGVIDPGEHPQYLQQLALVFNALAESAVDPLPTVIAEMEQLAERGDWDGVLGSGQVAIDQNLLREDNTLLDFSRLMADASLKVGRPAGALEYIEIAELYALDAREAGVEPDGTQLGRLFDLQAQIHLEEEDSYEALWAWNRALIFAPPESQSALRESVTAVSEKVRNEFVDLPYHRRSVLYLAKGVGMYGPDECMMFPRSTWPTGLSFPAGHPREDELYVGHPYQPSVYLPVDNYEVALFREKYMELCRLLHCLGASKVELQAADSGALTHLEEASENMSMEGTYGLAKGNASYDSQSQGTTSQQHRRDLAVTQTFAPPTEVSVPDDLVWFDHEPEWKLLAKQRLAGGILTHTLSFGTEDIEVVDENRRLKVAAELDAMAGGGSGTWTERLSTNRQSNWKTGYRVHVEFHPIQGSGGTAEPNSVPQLSESGGRSADEQDYFEMLVDAWDDDVVTEDERRMLDRMRERWGITAERAAEIELEARRVASPAPEELDYREMLIDALEDGVITDDERRLLDRMRERWGISPERAAEIEAELSPAPVVPLTDAESEYLEEVRFAWDVGNKITDGERRLLERLRVKLGLSEERATELESMVES